MYTFLLTALLTSFVPAAQAGFVAGAMGGADVPIPSGTRSDLGPGFGIYGGWLFDTGGVNLQPELTAHWSLSTGTLVPAAGGTLTLGSFWRAGAYAHVGLPVMGGYPFPAGDAGLLVESHQLAPLVIGARAGWSYAAAVHLKCGNCPQPADHLLTGLLQLGVAFE